MSKVGRFPSIFRQFGSEKILPIGKRWHTWYFTEDLLEFFLIS